jgi:hypothetical protein
MKYSSQNFLLFFIAGMLLWNCAHDSSATADSSAANIQHNLSNFSKPFVPLEDFDRPPSCTISGIIDKFLSWGYDRSDEVARELIPLAIEIEKYAALHEQILKSWEAGSPV